MGYKNKSDIYFDSAQQLNKQYLYSAVPHSAYYSCFLIMESIYYDKCEQPYNSSDQPAVQGGIHVRITNFIKGLLNTSNKTKELQDFVAKIQQLKQLRLKADYRSDDIYINDSSKSIALAREVLQILNKI